MDKITKGLDVMIDNLNEIVKANTGDNPCDALMPVIFSLELVSGNVIIKDSKKITSASINKMLINAKKIPSLKKCFVENTKCEVNQIISKDLVDQGICIAPNYQVGLSKERMKILK